MPAELGHRHRILLEQVPGPGPVVGRGDGNAFADRIEANVKAELERSLRLLTNVGADESLHRELIKTADGKAWAGKVYAEARPGYNPITQQAIERALKGESGG